MQQRPRPGGSGMRRYHRVAPPAPPPPLPAVVENEIRRKSIYGRSVTYHDLTDFDDVEGPEVTEVTPLLLSQGLDEILGVPTDKFNAVAVCFLYLGMCTMLPWNFLISITSFWNYKFRETNATAPVPYLITNVTNVTSSPHYLDMYSFQPHDVISSGGDIYGGAGIPPPPALKPTEMQLSFPSYVSIASNIPGALTTLMHSLFGQRVGVSTRMVWALSLLMTSFVCLLALSIPDCDLWQMQYLHVVLMLIVLSNVGVNVLQGSMFGVSGRFPPFYAGCVMMGQAFGGVLPAIGAILMITFNIEPRLLGPASFGIIIALLLLALGAERWLAKNKFFLYFAEGKDNHITGDTSDHDAEVDRICYKDIIKRSWIYLVGGWTVYATTLSVFPALATIVKSTQDTEWTDKYFTPVACILVFNLSDLMGRTLATYLQWPGRSLRGQMTFLVLVLLRVSVVPLVMLCNAAPGARHQLPVVFDSDAVFCCLVVVLGLSVGYLGNLALIQAPKTSDMAESQEATSLILTAFYVLGQASGSFLSYFILKSI